MKIALSYGQQKIPNLSVFAPQQPLSHSQQNSPGYFHFLDKKRVLDQSHKYDLSGQQNIDGKNVKQNFGCCMPEHYKYDIFRLTITMKIFHSYSIAPKLARMYNLVDWLQEYFF